MRLRKAAESPIFKVFLRSRFKVSAPLRVTNPPSKPLVIWDGDCHFCRRWIERWREQTGNRVEYESSQRIAPRFPEIVSAEFERSLVLVLPSGEVYRGAEAAVRSLGFARHAWLLRIYKDVAAVASISDAAYQFIAKNRQLGSRLLWGGEVSCPDRLTRRIFLRGLGAVAFVSFWCKSMGSGGRVRHLTSARFLLRSSRRSMARGQSLPCQVFAGSIHRMQLCTHSVQPASLLWPFVGFVPLISHPSHFFTDRRESVKDNW